MTKGQKIVTASLWAVLVIVMVGVIGAAAWDRMHPTEKPLPVFWPAPAFSLVDQNDKPLTDRSLRGSPYIAAFVFTQCAGPCPMMTSKMAKLQKAIANPAVKFVSFSVDPMRDTPAVLKAYAERFGADPARWHFVTGKPEGVYAVAAGMKISAVPAEANSPIIHSTKLILVDAEGQVRGNYDTGDTAAPDVMDRLIHDANQLAAGGAR